MVVFNYTGRELSGKIVYYGPALSGKTTNLEHIYGQTPATTRGKMVSMKTKAERTLFFDLLPINRGTIGDFKVRFLLYTVPGQVYYNATRKLVLKGADAIVFVADSQRSQLAANVDSLRNLRTNLLEYGMSLDDLPWVIAYNKRDMPDAMTMEELERELNPYGVPSFGQVAVTGEGVFESFEKVSEMLMQRLETQLRGDAGAKGEPRRPQPAPPPHAPVPAGSPIDASALREVRDAIQSVVPPAPPSRPHAVTVEMERPDSLVIQRGFDGLEPRPSPPRAAPPVAHPAAAPAVAVAPRMVAPSPSVPPLVVERSIAVPLSAADVAGRRRIRIVLDITLDPQS
jgi:signal recognition particle receptor subunit beta